MLNWMPRPLVITAMFGGAMVVLLLLLTQLALMGS